MRLDRIIVSSNENMDYLEFSKIIGPAWKKLLPDVKVTLLCVTDKDKNEFLDISKFYDDVIFLPNVENIPSGNQAMASRMLIAATETYKDETIMLSDIDMLPLNKDFFIDSIANISDDKFVVLGGNAYNNSIKFPICYMIAKQQTFTEILNPGKMEYKDLVERMKAVKGSLINHDITKPYPTTVGSPRFDDESLFSEFYLNWKDRNTRTVIVNRAWSGGMAVERIDRISWNINMDRLNGGHLYDAHLPRPLSTNIDKIQPLLTFLNITL